jgi:hypothetical protein
VRVCNVSIAFPAESCTRQGQAAVLCCVALHCSGAVRRSPFLSLSLYLYHSHSLSLSLSVCLSLLYMARRSLKAWSPPVEAGSFDVGVVVAFGYLLVSSVALLPLPPPPCIAASPSPS